MSVKNECIDTLEAWLATARRDSVALPPAVIEQVRAQALGVAQDAELAQTLAVLDELGADADTLSAAALFACMAPEQIPQDLVPVALIEGQREAEKVWSIYEERRASGHAEGLRRLLLAIVRDLRVVLILLARQLVRLRAAVAAADAEAQALARLSADIHAPLANRLGIWQLKWEMEDLVFRILQPETYRRVARLLDEKRGDRERFIADARAQLQAALDQAGIEAEVAGRPKHIFSIWKKMQKKQLGFDDLYDIRALRVLVKDVTACYTVLGLVHGLWVPIPSEFDDYIAHPKPNNYRSLHTVVVGPGGKSLEVQIRTFEMHSQAELGVAAHWRYKEGGAGDAEFERKIAWMRQLLDSSREEDGDAPLLAGLSTELIEDRVYALTPQGQVIDLPLGGTVLDFAYRIHTEVGHRCRGAKVNGRIVPLTFQPGSGDRIEILTAKNGEPRRDWLAPGAGYLGSARAREKVRSWFHRLDHARNVQAGREMLDKELKRLGLHQMDLAPVLARLKLGKLDELQVAVALGDVSCSQVARLLHESMSPASASESRPAGQGAGQLKPSRAAQGFLIEGVGNLMVQLARCCQPVAGDAIGGYLTRGRGVSVHRSDCATFRALAERDAERILPVEWGRDDSRQGYSVDILVRAWDRKWLLKDVTSVISSAHVHIMAVNSRVDEDGGQVELRFTLRVGDFGQLGQLLSRIEAVPAVREARRLH